MPTLALALPLTQRTPGAREISHLFILNKSDITLVKVDWSTIKHPDLIWFVLQKRGSWGLILTQAVQQTQGFD